jgi:hypothetical protein
MEDLQFCRIGGGRRPTGNDEAVQEAHWDPTQPDAG